MFVERDSMIKERQLRDDINAMRKMLPNGVFLDAKPYYDKNVITGILNETFPYSRMSFSDEVQKLRSTIEMLSAIVVFLTMLGWKKLTFQS
jgi:hypothetical protein